MKNSVTSYKLQVTSYKVQGTRYKVQGTRYKSQGTSEKLVGGVLTPNEFKDKSGKYVGRKRAQPVIRHGGHRLPGKSYST